MVSKNAEADGLNSQAGLPLTALIDFLFSGQKLHYKNSNVIIYW